MSIILKQDLLDVGLSNEDIEYNKDLLSFLNEELLETKK